MATQATRYNRFIPVFLLFAHKAVLDAARRPGRYAQRGKILKGCRPAIGSFLGAP
jgi:hypothetical protein